MRPNSRTLPNLKEHGNVFRQHGENHLKMSTCRTQIQKLGLHVPMCRRYAARVTAFPGKCREMSKTPTNRDRRQMSKRMSRHICLGQGCSWRSNLHAHHKGNVSTLFHAPFSLFACNRSSSPLSTSLFFRRAFRKKEERCVQSSVSRRLRTRETVGWLHFYIR